MGRWRQGWEKIGARIPRGIGGLLYRLDSVSTTLLNLANRKGNVNLNDHQKVSRGKGSRVVRLDTPIESPYILTLKSPGGNGRKILTHLNPRIRV